MGIRRASGFVMVLIAAGLTQGCPAMNDPRGTREQVDALLNGGDHTSRALNALTYGEMTQAETQTLIALRENPKDPFALYVAGMVYQATGRYELARQYYEALIASRPQVSITTLTQGAPQVRSLIDVAQANLLVVDKLTGRYTPRTATQSGRVLDLPPPGAIEPTLPPLPRGTISAQPLDAPTALSPAARDGDPQAEAEANVAGRFRILKRLLDEGLLTPEEYGKRRAANLGGLLPYSTAVPPVQGLERPIPTDIQVVDRLRAIGQSLETRALSPAEHSAERLTILDALLPAEPRKLDLPVLPPRDVMEAASAVGRVERMRNRGLVTDDEARAEKLAAERLLDAQLARQSTGVSATGLRQGSPPAAPPAKTKGGGGSGRSVGLATAPSEDEAHAAWDQLKTKYPEDLGSLSPTFRSEQGAKGPRWRVVAGPLKSNDAARKLCKQLKLYRQACDVVN